ncbi:hypothetical protein K2F43_16650 [Clostridium estertheticum]|uniref:hypothetical protein n=1 Tax=Clostridium estertheticum TaxID=238834 RepID=UPI001C6E8AEF|nr:hypothetical protein [Clostridium estertheticum]MBW9172836.1 hypothetical protein [Clostridium estertheticum]WLC77643.1 hypothetical protein KTC99_23100 [Clostridium estertheticum]
MDYIHYALNILISIFIIIVITKIYMMVAKYIGEQLRLGKFLIYLWRKIRMKK